MGTINTSVLQEYLANLAGTNPAINKIQQQLGEILATGDPSIQSLVSVYDQLYPELEKQLWLSSEFDELLQIYQALFREQEDLIRFSGEDDRYEFILSIPIADRPQHLHQCLESIYQLCLLYNYGGQKNGVFNKIRVVVAEDSRQALNIEKDIQLARQYSNLGLEVTHFAQDEQFALLQKIPATIRQRLDRVLTNQPAQRFYLKGQAANRNLSYLKMQQMTRDKTRTLYYLVDSDQAFQLNRQTENGEQCVAALNYFYYINRIFSSTDTRILTGKLVGDPPVSPSVMAANFLDDVLAFLTKIGTFKGDQHCQFHGLPSALPGDAAYHDMAGLFGFEQLVESYDYRCRLSGRHTHLDCVEDFCARLDDFFFGEHLTRKTIFQYQGNFETLAPARTIYPGNYIANYEGLKYIIPFGHLRLRMSGPTAGRLIQAEIGARFASANIPMLHKRTTTEEHALDFRPGVEKKAQIIDLSDEFERQFFGDLMLFSVIEILQHWQLDQAFDAELITRCVDKVESELLELYQAKHQAVMEKMDRLKTLLQQSGTWWHNLPGAAHLQRFLNNIDLNFGSQSKAYHQQIMSAEHRSQRKQQIIEALLHYPDERAAWDSLFQ